MGGQTNKSSVIALLSVLARTSCGKYSLLTLKARHARGAPWRRRPSLTLHIHIWSYPSERITLMNCKTLLQDKWQDTKQEFSVLLCLLQPALFSCLVSCRCRILRNHRWPSSVFQVQMWRICLIDMVRSLSLSRLCPKIRRLYLNRIVYFEIERFLCKVENFS
jgi:hypothetical protein